MASLKAQSGIKAAEKSPLLGMVWLGLLCAALAFAPWLGGQMGGAMPAVARGIVAAAGLAWLADRWGKCAVPRPVAWLWLFIGWSVVTAFQKTYLHASLLALSDLVSYATLATLAADAARSGKRRQAVIMSLLLGLAAQSSLGVWEAKHSASDWRVFASFATPNLLASYLLTLLPLATLQLLPEDDGVMYNKKWPSIISLISVCSVMLGAGVLLHTGSKGAVLSCFVAIGVVIGFLRLYKQVPSQRWIALLSLGVLAFLFGGDTLLGRVATANTTEVHSSQFRVLTWEGAARMAAAHPVLGTGIGTFGTAFNRYAIAGWTVAAHNAYLQTAAETGFVGLALFLTALGSAAAMLYRRARGDDMVKSVLSAGALAGLLAAALHNLVDYGWELWAPSAVLWALIGLGGAREERNAGADIIYSPSLLALSKRMAFGMALVLAATLVGNLLVANAAVQSDSVTEAETPPPPEAAVAAYHAARRLDPLDAKLAQGEARALASAGHSGEAMDSLKEAAILSPDDPVAWRLLGEANLAANQVWAASADFAHGLEAAPNSMKLLLEAARERETAGHPEDAMVLYRRLIAVAEGPVGNYPATPEIVDTEPLAAYAAIATVEEKQGDPVSARRHWKSLVELAGRYETNRSKYPLLWKATHRDDPAELAAVQAQRAEAKAHLAKLPG